MEPRLAHESMDALHLHIVPSDLINRRLTPRIVRCLFKSEMVLSIPYSCLRTFTDRFLQAAVDNNYWGGDLDIPTPRPSYQINDT
jgi:hypothetical protein